MIKSHHQVRTEFHFFVYKLFFHNQQGPGPSPQS